ncbi:Hypothetical Protein FCC1311_089842 [Hondaea fermentalgiana]|uniref:Uncharacterized protein n=1 Tax=Hondaea fermentalgiana TaxID=2315210 RepID=A0A2R5GR21_9STRA|nr:Hypothetical Protein FCC1311_089842 [Hondaea fermentalgiana]|eukprot:GBG32759.1 Hypothetical Protein FCC1311_089842 [Hondaea fermentalgiana]
MQQQAHQLQRENREFRLLGDNKTPTEALRGLSTLYGATVTHFDVQELVSDFGFNNDPLRTCIRILGAFEVVSRDEITNELVWNGMGRAFRGISGVVQDAVVSSSKATLVHLARRLTVVGFNEIMTPGPFNPWCAHELLSKYINLLVAPLSESNLDEMIAFFVELGYAIAIANAAIIWRLQRRRLAPRQLFVVIAIEEFQHGCAGGARAGFGSVKLEENVQKVRHSKQSGICRVIALAVPNTITIAGAGVLVGKLPSFGTRPEKGAPSQGFPATSTTQLSYLQHPLPVPKTAQGHPANAALVTERVLSDKEPKALESEPPLPTPSQMLKYQISCVEEFMTRYCAYYSKVTGNPIKVLTPEDLAMGNESQDGANSSRQSEVLGTQRKSELSVDVKKDNGPSLLSGSQSKESPQHQAISANQLKENMSRNGSAREDDVVLENEAPAALSALPSPRAASSTRNEFPDAVFSQDSMGSFSGTSQIFNISQEMLNISQFNLSQNSLSSLGPLGLSSNMENDCFPSSQVESSADRLGSFYEGLDKDIEQELTDTPEPARES